MAQTAAAGYTSLTQQSGLPAYVLEYFENAGILDVEHFDEEDLESSSSTLIHASVIAGMRDLGFTLGQIAAIIKGDTSKSLLASGAAIS